MGRNSSGVNGIRLRDGRSRWSAWSSPIPTPRCSPPANGYGKRTPFGPNSPVDERRSARLIDDETEPLSGEAERHAGAPTKPNRAEGEETESTAARYPTKRRGGKGLRDITHRAQRPGDRHRPRPRRRRSC